MSIENGVSKRPHSSGVLLLRSENKQVATCVIKYGHRSTTFHLPQGSLAGC